MILVLNVDLMKYFLIAALLLAGYLFLLKTAASRMANKRLTLTLAVVLLALYAAITVPMLIILHQMGNSNFVLLAIMVLLSSGILLVAIYALFRDFWQIKKRALILFVLYLLPVAYVTIFSRSEGHSRAILLRFDSIHDAIQTKSLEPLRHAFLNAIMFIPIGFLLPPVNSEKLDSFMIIGALGLSLSTTIEATQMLLRIGQCDVEDIAANTLGTLIGLVMYRVYAHFTHKDDEEEYEYEEE